MRIEGIAALCDVFGVSHQTVADWQKEGMPVLERGGAKRPSVFDSVAVHAWVVTRALAKVQGERPQDRLARAQAIRVEIDIAEAQKLLIPVDAVEPKWRAACIAAREQLLRARRRLVERLARCKDAKARSAAIGEVHEQFLRTLADWRGAGEKDDAE